MVDKNLFMYDLAIVAIMKNESHYLKEWLDYHLLAGVEHFYLYDNDSTDNQAEVAKPYVEAGLVDYISAPGKTMQYVAYNDAVKNFRFHCRYMAFIDGDEFIYPRLTGGGVIEVVDEILSCDPNAAGLGIHWQCFGSNGQDIADYNRGVLERFTRRAHKDWFLPPRPKENFLAMGNCYIKNIVDPRKIKFFFDPHTMIYFEGLYGVDETSKPVTGSIPVPIAADKIVINHYYVKSREEFLLKVNRGSACREVNHKKMEYFDISDQNDEFDDGILKYREARAKVFQPPDKSHADKRLFAALANNLSPTLFPTTSSDFYVGKLETFLTCRAVASYLQTKLYDKTPAKFFEEASLRAILKSLASGASFAELRLLLRELPNLLILPSPVVKELRETCLQILPQMMEVMHLNNNWMDFVELDYLRRLLQTWK